MPKILSSLKNNTRRIICASIILGTLSVFLFTNSTLALLEPESTKSQQYMPVAPSSNSWEKPADSLIILTQPNLQILASLPNQTSKAEYLIQLLGIKGLKEFWRKIFIEILVKIGKPAIAPLINALGSNNSNVRQGAADVLVKIGKPAIAPLINALGSYDPQVRQGAADALVKIGKPAIAPLIALLGNDDYYLVEGAALALGKIGVSAIASLINALGSDSYNMRCGAAEALGIIGKPAIVSLLHALGSDNPNMRLGAAQALGRIGEQAITSLIPLLGNDNSYLVDGAAEALAIIGEPAVASLINALTSGNPIMRSGAAQSLGRMAQLHPQLSIFIIAVDPLIKALKDDDPNVRIWVASALGNIGYRGDGRVVGPLLKALVDQSLSVRYEAENALRKTIFSPTYDLSPVEIDDLINLLGEGNSYSSKVAEYILLAKGDTEVIEYLRERINNEDSPIVRQNIERIIQGLEEKINLQETIRERFQIEVKWFTPEELKAILVVLKALPFKLIEGLHEIRGGAPGNFYDSVNKAVLVFSSAYAILCHEIGHFIDDKYFGFNAFRELYAASQYDEDYAWSYGKTNQLEDFATAVDYYIRNSKKEFLRAISQAENGKPVYLEKLLFVLDVFTKGNPRGDATMYLVTIKSGILESILTKNIRVTRDSSGKITHINNISIDNLSALKQFFTSLEF